MKDSVQLVLSFGKYKCRRMIAGEEMDADLEHPTLEEAEMELQKEKKGKKFKL